MHSGQNEGIPAKNIEFLYALILSYNFQIVRTENRFKFCPCFCMHSGQNKGKASIHFNTNNFVFEYVRGLFKALKQIQHLPCTVVRTGLKW